jgi:hypothetical protein
VPGHPDRSARLDACAAPAHEYHRCPVRARPCSPHDTLDPCTLADVWPNSQPSAPPSAVNRARHRPKQIRFEHMCLPRPCNRSTIIPSGRNRQQLAPPVPATPTYGCMPRRRLSASGAQTVNHGRRSSNSSRRVHGRLLSTSHRGIATLLLQVYF